MGAAVGGKLPESLAPHEQALLVQHFDVLTPENCMKPGPIHPERGRLDVAMGDALRTRLEKAGLVRREADPDDGRRTLVHFVEEGPAQRELGRIFAAFGNQVAAVVAGYDDEQVRTLLDFVTRTAEVLESQAVELRRR